MKIKKILLTLGIAVMAAMTFVGCSSGEETTEETTTTEAAAQAEEADQTEEAAPTEEMADESEVAEVNSKDGVYRVEYDQPDEQGMKTFLEVTIKEGAVANVSFDEVNVSDDEADDALEQALLTAKTPEEFEQMVEGQAEAETFKAFAAQIVKQIEQGNQEVSVINK